MIQLPDNKTCQLNLGRISVWQRISPGTPISMSWTGACASSPTLMKTTGMSGSSAPSAENISKCWRNYYHDQTTTTPSLCQQHGVAGDRLRLQRTAGPPRDQEESRIQQQELDRELQLRVERVGAHTILNRTERRTAVLYVVCGQDSSSWEVIGGD